MPAYLPGFQRSRACQALQQDTRVRYAHEGNPTLAGLGTVAYGSYMCSVLSARVSAWRFLASEHHGFGDCDFCAQHTIRSC